MAHPRRLRRPIIAAELCPLVFIRKLRAKVPAKLRIFVCFVEKQALAELGVVDAGPSQPIEPNSRGLWSRSYSSIVIQRPAFIGPRPGTPFDLSIDDRVDWQSCYM